MGLDERSSGSQEQMSSVSFRSDAELKIWLYAGISGVSDSTHKSENLFGADNQQGRIRKEKNMKYRVEAWRHDVSGHTVGTFGAHNDDEAKKIFNDQYVKNPRYAMDQLELKKVIQEEKLQHITGR